MNEGGTKRLVILGTAGHIRSPWIIERILRWDEPDKVTDEKSRKHVNSCVPCSFWMKVHLINIISHLALNKNFTFTLKYLLLIFISRKHNIAFIYTEQDRKLQRFIKLKLNYIQLYSAYGKTNKSKSTRTVIKKKGVEKYLFLQLCLCFSIQFLLLLKEDKSLYLWHRDQLLETPGDRERPFIRRLDTRRVPRRKTSVPGAQSPRKDISWTVIWDYSHKNCSGMSGDYCLLLSLWFGRNMVGSHLGYYHRSSPTVLRRYTVGGFKKGNCYRDTCYNNRFK